MTTRDDFKNAASLKRHLEGFGYDMTGLEKALDGFLKLTKTQVPVAAVGARAEGHVLPGLLCVTQDYVIFVKPDIGQDRYHFWKALRQDAVFSDTLGSQWGNIQIYVRNTETRAFLAEPRDKLKLFKFIESDRHPNFQPPPL